MRICIGLIGWILATSLTAAAQQVGTCEYGTAETFLDANSVRAAIYNGGNIFWRGSHVGTNYMVPAHLGVDAIFAAGLWLGGLVDGELRFAGANYGPFEYYPGPLTDDGELPDPSDCSAFDRIFEVTVRDLERLDATGKAAEDIRDWPWQLGAPVEDGDGNPDNYDLAAGDRPKITGHEMLWWVMNDVGGPHGWGKTPPIGIEVQVSAFAVMSEEAALDESTFYRYRLANKQDHAIEDLYLGWFVDTDLGNWGDDLVGSDTSLGMGFIYNGDNDDENRGSSPGYGPNPPALGVDVIQGPLATTDGIDNDDDGSTDEDGERRGLTVFLSNSSDGSATGNPFGAQDAYNFLQGIWRDGKPMTFGGTGYGGDRRTTFMFPGDPVTRSYWSELNTDGAGTPNNPSDRTFNLSTGPFRLEPGESEEIVIAVVWARGRDHLDSITELRKADRIVQDTWDSKSLDEAPVPPLPSAPPALLSPAHGAKGQPLNVTLNWNPVPYASEYDIEVAASRDFEGPSYRIVTTIAPTAEVDSLMPFTEYYWRVRARSALFETPFSEASRFSTSNEELSEFGFQTIPGSSIPAFLEIVGPGGVDPCGPDAVSTGGCIAAGGNLVYGSYNSTGEYVMYHVGAGPEETLHAFAPHDFDIRFTEEGSYGIFALSSGRIIHVPFEVWDVGPVGLFNENDPLDDVQLIPVLFADGGGDCAFDYDEGDDPFGLGWGMSDRVYAYYAVESYESWEGVVRPLVERESDGCYEGDATHLAQIDMERGRPLQRIIFIGDPAVENAPGAGAVIRFYTSPHEVVSPILAAPASGTGPYAQPLTLFWNAQRGAEVTYQIQVSPGPTFDNAVVDATTSKESFTVSGLEEGRTYLWRVRVSVREAPWSKTWTFTAGEVTNVTAEQSLELPTETTLRQNFPNPFNPSTTIRFGLPESGPVRVVVYDLLGRTVATLVDRPLPAGWHEVTWDASQSASGVYVYHLETGLRRTSKTLVLAK